MFAQADISAELAQTTRHLNDTQRQLQLLQGSTAQQSLTTRQELSANKQEQASTRHQLSSTNRELTSTRQDVERLQAALEVRDDATLFHMEDIFRTCSLLAILGLVYLPPHAVSQFLLSLNIFCLVLHGCGLCSL